MISILGPRAWIAAVALCVASVGIGYWRGNVAGRASVQAKWNQERAEQQAAASQNFANAVAAANEASAAYQQGKANEQERIRMIRQTVVRTVAGPCLSDDGLRNVNEAIGGVPPASAAR